MAFEPVPSLKTINALAGTNGFKVISTFSGTGGSSLGYRWAGFKILAALEFLQEAADSYAANFPDTPILVKDIRETHGSELLALAGLKVGELDVLDGSPPCKSFSTGALREKAWGQQKEYSEGQFQRTDDLFFEYARLIGEIQPKVFVAENVKGLVSGKAKGYYMEFHAALEAAAPGYVVQNRTIDAQQLGVPQARQRLIIIGIRRDLAEAHGLVPTFPRQIFAKWKDKPEDMDQTMPRPPTIAEAFAGLPQPDPNADPKQCHWPNPAKKTYFAWSHTNPFSNSGMLRDAYLKLWGQNARYHWFRQRPDRPSVTVTATIPCLLHWAQCRTYTIPEIMRLQTFPDDFNITGNYEQQYERVGRSVPPRLMQCVAERIRDEILVPLSKAAS